MADNSLKLTDVDRAILSTNSSADTGRSQFMQGVDHRFKDKLDLSTTPDSRFNLQWVNPLDPDLLKRMQFNDDEVDDYLYDGMTPITSIASSVYGTSTLWYVIVYASGFTNPLSVPGGTMLRVPKPLVLSEKMKKLTTYEKQKGKVVQI